MSHRKIAENGDLTNEKVNGQGATGEQHAEAESQADRPAGLPMLTEDQSALMAKHLGLVGVHLRTRVPTPRTPTRQREYDDLFQEGCVGLARAAARYRPDRDGPFAAYALPRIRGAVHAALHERFSLIPIPARAKARAKAANQPLPMLLQEPLHGLGKDPALSCRAAQPAEHEQETLRHRLRWCYERGIDLALADLRSRKWSRRNPCAIMSRIAAERLLVTREDERTPLRRIARETGVSSGRACAYERMLLETVQAWVARDPELPVIMKWVREEPEGLDGALTFDRQRELERVRRAAFRSRFEHLDRLQRAEAIYALLEGTAGSVTEIAVNLYRLNASPDGEVDPTLMMTPAA